MVKDVGSFVSDLSEGVSCVELMKVIFFVKFVYMIFVVLFLFEKFFLLFSYVFKDIEDFEEFCFIWWVIEFENFVYFEVFVY